MKTTQQYSAFGDLSAIISRTIELGDMFFSSATLNDARPVAIELSFLLIRLQETSSLFRDGFDWLIPDSRDSPGLTRLFGATISAKDSIKDYAISGRRDCRDWTSDRAVLIEAKAQIIRLAAQIPNVPIGLTRADAAKIATVDQGTISRAISGGKLAELPNGRVDEFALRTWMAKHHKPANKRDESQLRRAKHKTIEKKIRDNASTHSRNNRAMQ